MDLIYFIIAVAAVLIFTWIILTLFKLRDARLNRLMVYIYVVNIKDGVSIKYKKKTNRTLKN
jgi:hypothetical protein